MATNTAGPTTPEKSTRRCQVTDNEKRSLRVLLAEQGKVRERKAAARRGADPKHKADWPAGFTPAGIGGRAAQAEGRRPLTAEEMELVRRLCQPEPFGVTPSEAGIMERFARDGIVKRHQDGTTELTVKGANIYFRTLERENQNECHDETQG